MGDAREKLEVFIRQINRSNFLDSKTKEWIVEELKSIKEEYKKEIKGWEDAIKYDID